MRKILNFILGLLAAPATTHAQAPPYSSQDFVLAHRYVSWKQQTSKIGKVLVEGFEVKTQGTDLLTFQENGTNYTLFKFDKEKGLIILVINPHKSLSRNAHQAFAELVKRANFSKHNLEK